MQRFINILCVVSIDQKENADLEYAVKLEENILNQLDCSVLAIKLPGFVTPVTLDELNVCSFNRASLSSSWPFRRPKQRIPATRMIVCV